MLNKETKVLVLGGTGLVGSSLARVFKARGFKNLLHPTRDELDLFASSDVTNFVSKHRPEVVINAAAKVGGIVANNTYRADFILDNLTIQNNVFNASLKSKVGTFLFMGSSCIYPKHATHPIKEDSLLTGVLEETNESYAVAKIAGLKSAENIRRQFGLNYFSLMPTNLYGPGNNFDPQHSHVIPGIISRMYDVIQSGGSKFEVWGSGKARREFLYVDDLADACLFLLEKSMSAKGDWPYFINVGVGEDITIKELVQKIADVMGYDGKFVFNTDYPDGTPRKLLDVSVIRGLGWKHSVLFDDGLKKVVDYFLSLKKGS